MKKTELGFVLLILLGALLKVLHIPGGGILHVLGFQALAIFYLFALLPLCSELPIKAAYQKVLKEDENYWRAFGTFATAWVFSILLLGILFKIQLWKGATIMLKLGLLTLLVSLIIAAVKLLKAKDDFYLNLMRRILPIGIVAFVLFNIPNVSLMKYHHKNAPLEYIQAYEDYLTYPDSVELQHIYEMEREKMHVREYENDEVEDSTFIKM
ncbi:MAG: hypothetical protein HOD63_06170 [Bacteroidetes bacterium]|jgi:hypothetical protein|nr:hypothetical protein [Bacteroidota bacterium]MBT5529698.1 hypothetical protein [Cytophagia bacterium]MBT3423761.1 hypothetical protein [Bacteroidota bacterium]MBT4338155.1 hypothetical protein [Bacteroidota bacterium]MBT4727982.1 hypothetical protein [Bacteroidota bacterium]